MEAGEVVRINGWSIKYHPDFVKFYTTEKYLLRLNVGSANDAKEIINQKVRAICNSAHPNSSTYPRLGNMKWLRAKKGVKIQEDRITGDYRLLFLPTNSEKNELTFFAIKDHDGVIEFLRDAHARVHNAAIDEFQIWEWEFEEEFSVDMTNENAEEIVDRVNQQLTEIIGEEEVERNQGEFLEVSRNCSIYRLGKFGIELDPSPEQIEHINSPSPMLLPGVAGTGKSTVLQYRYRNAMLSYGDQIEEFFKKSIYLTLNKPLASTTKREVKKIIPTILEKKIDDGGIQDLNTWVSALLGEEAAISRPNLTFEHFRTWWSKRTHLYQYDPAQAWEEYRGVIKGTSQSIEEQDGALSAETYLNLPLDRCAYPMHERAHFYEDIVEPFQEYRKQSDNVYYDDQDLIRKVKEMQLPPLYRHIFIDEVQDLTELQLNVIMTMLIQTEKCDCVRTQENCSCPPSCTNCHCLIFDATGDLSQQVYPTRFRWEDTSRAIFEGQGRKCYLRESMSTSYRSVRSIVDLSTYYLKKMNRVYRQNNNDEILQAQSEQKAETPAVLEKESSELYKILVEAELPAAHSPIIVRDESSKTNLIEHLHELTNIQIKEALMVEFPNSEEVQEENFKSRIKFPLDRISNYTLTIAEAKGLEWNNVILWEITSGSDFLLEKKLHERQGNYIDDEDWNYQLELRHAFVATTRARLLLLHLGSVRDQYPDNPFYSDLLQKELVTMEKEPVDISRFSRAELTREEYEDMAEDYGSKEMFGAAALIFRNNLDDEQRATEMEYFDAKKRDDVLQMADKLIEYENNWGEESLGQKEKEYVLERLNIEGDETELGFLIEIAEMLNRTAMAKLARIKRNEKLADFFKTSDAYRTIASDYEQLGQEENEGNYHERAGDFYEKAADYTKAIRCWWTAKKYSKAWERIGRILAPNENQKFELLWISLLTKKSLEKDELELFQETFDVKYNSAAHEMLNKLNVLVRDTEFLTYEGKRKAEEIAFEELIPEERASLYFQKGNWQLGLEVYLEESHLDFNIGLECCKTVSPVDLFDWYKSKIEENKNNLNQKQKFAFFNYHFKRSTSNRPSILDVKKYLLSLDLSEAKRHHLGANSLLQKWYHALFLVTNPQNANSGSGKANLQVAIRWYIDEKTLESELLLHSIRCGLFEALFKTYNTFLENQNLNRKLSKNSIKNALPCVELYLKTLMHPKRFTARKYSELRRSIIAMVKDTGLYDFIDSWFDYFLDMGPNDDVLKRHQTLKRDIQFVFPMFKDKVLGYTSGILPSLGFAPYNSISRTFDSDKIKHSFSEDGLKVLIDTAYKKGQINNIMKLANEVNDDMKNLLEVYVDTMMFNQTSDILPSSFFEIIQNFLDEHSDNDIVEHLEEHEFLKESGEDEILDVATQLTDIQEENLTDQNKMIESDSLEQVEGVMNTEENDDEQGSLPSERQMEMKTGGISPASDQQEVEEESVHEQRYEDILQLLHTDQPDNVQSWFGEQFSSMFSSENSSFIITNYNLFLEKLEQSPEVFSENTINEWLCFHEILKIMREKFNFPENPYQSNTRIAARLAEARRSVASQFSSYPREKVSALIQIR